MEIITGILIIGYCALILCFAIAWDSHADNHPKAERKLTLSVIIPVRNEVGNIISLLNDLNLQTYPRELFEVIVVDDASKDGTIEVIEGFIRRYHENFKLIKEDGRASYPTPKKKALSRGVQCANGEVILTTDGDCRVDNGWLASVAEQFQDEDIHFVSGPVVFEKDKTLFERLQVMEFASLIGVGASSIRLGYPNICNGANLAFRKDKFLDHDGYEGNGHIASGDDEFLLQKFAAKGTHHICFIKDRKAIIKTRPKEDLKDFYHQRKRWTSKLKHHKRWHIRVLSMLVFLVNLSILLSLATVMLGWFEGKWLFVLFVLKFFAEGYFMKNIFDFFGRTIKWLEFFLLSIIHPFYIVLFGIFTNFGTFKWKGRTYHE